MRRPDRASEKPHDVRLPGLRLVLKSSVETLSCHVAVRAVTMPTGHAQSRLVQGALIADLARLKVSVTCMANPTHIRRLCAWE